MYRKQVLLEKLREAAASVLPISLIVLAICFVLVPVDTGLMLSFVLGDGHAHSGHGSVHARRGNVHEQASATTWARS